MNNIGPGDIPPNLPEQMQTLLMELRQSSGGMTEAQAIDHHCDKLNMALLGIRSDVLSNQQFQSMMLATAIVHELKRLARIIVEG